MFHNKFFTAFCDFYIFCLNSYKAIASGKSLTLNMQGKFVHFYTNTFYLMNKIRTAEQKSLKWAAT